MEREGAAVTCDGRLFHRRAAATVYRRVRRTSRDVDEAERIVVWLECLLVDVCDLDLAAP